MLVWVAAAGHRGGDEAVPRMATQKWLPSRHLHFEPGKMTGSVRAVAGFVREEEKWKWACTPGCWQQSSSFIPVSFTWHFKDWLHQDHNKENIFSLADSLFKTVDRVAVWSFQLTGHCFLTWEALLLMQQMKFLSPPFYSGANRRLRYLKIEASKTQTIFRARKA